MCRESQQLFNSKYSSTHKPGKSPSSNYGLGEGNTINTLESWYQVGGDSEELIPSF